jgi:serine/threonine protein kinase
MHSRGIIHRDIKPENILLTKQLNIKLIDFGTANYCGPEHYRSTKIGSLPYFAPEIVQKRGHNEAVDVWCVGILLYELHAFRTPFEHESNTELNILVKTG